MSVNAPKCPNEHPLVLLAAGKDVWECDGGEVPGRCSKAVTAVTCEGVPRYRCGQNCDFNLCDACWESGETIEGQARTGRGIHGRTKVSCGPAMPDPYMPCGRATPQGAGQGGLPAAVFFPLEYPFPYRPVEGPVAQLIQCVR
jgi:hypothetical protein